MSKRDVAKDQSFADGEVWRATRTACIQPTTAPGQQVAFLTTIGRLCSRYIDRSRLFANHISTAKQATHCSRRRRQAFARAVKTSGGVCLG